MRRAWLRCCRSRYVEQMERLRVGTPDGAPHAVLDPRDLKFCRNICDADWAADDDPFRWRERLPFARWGLAELIIMGTPLAVATSLLVWLGTPWAWLAILPAILFALVVWFFRDPPRAIPDSANLMVAPADGKVVDIAPAPDDPYLQQPAVKVGIFLSIFNVHINRAPDACRVIQLVYRPGEFLNALNPDSLERNESLWIGLEQESPPHRKLSVRQVSGLFARRIVCQLRSGEVLERGEKFGMIKLGSRTELILPADGLQLEVEVGQKVRAGSTVIGRYAETRPS